MKPLANVKGKYEVFFLRMHPIKQNECTAFILPKGMSLKSGKIITLISSCKEVKYDPIKVKVGSVVFKPIKKLTLKEIDSLRMIDDYEIREPEGVQNNCYFSWKAVELLPEDHPYQWIDGGNHFCEECATKVMDAIRESCVEKATCERFKENGNCDGCRIADYEEGNSCNGIDSDSVETCMFEWKENDERHGCGNLIEFCATDECAESEMERFLKDGFRFESDSDRHSLKQIAEHVPGLFPERSKENNLLKKLLLHAIWDTHWHEKHPYKTNPVVGYHTFEIV